MIREIDLAFIKIHLLFHTNHLTIFGVGLIAELDRYGYKLSPSTLYPVLANMERLGLLTRRRKTVAQKQRKYFRITPAGQILLKETRRKARELYLEGSPK